MLVIDPPLPSGLTRETLGIVYPWLKPSLSIYPIKNPENENLTVTVVEFDTTEHCKCSEMSIYCLASSCIQAFVLLCGNFFTTKSSRIACYDCKNIFEYAFAKEMKCIVFMGGTSHVCVMILEAG